MTRLSVEALRRRGERRLKDAGVPDAPIDAAWLLGYLLECDRASLFLRREEAVSEAGQARYEALLARRAAGEPLQYIIGTQDFFGRPFRVRPGALIPRPETEGLALRAIGWLRDSADATELSRSFAALDLCTGSGALAVTLALECPESDVYATDLSDEALTLARENAAALGARVRFLKGDLFGALKDKGDGPHCPAPGSPAAFDLIVCNPPYIPAAEIAGLQREVREYEPRAALDGGADGLAFYRRIAAEAAGYLRPGGALFLEVGAGQGAAVRALLEGAPGFTGAEVFPDLAGLPRVVFACRGQT
ncbi:MAG: peptide chain release factor N(5)-glutamine methyltransferase [Clostridiales bacterium]|nr:peptide chain release factor N(5)-glutamine methyltransferase [Clostridiales bacterium]